MDTPASQGPESPFPDFDTAPYSALVEIGKGAYGKVYLAQGPSGYCALKVCSKPAEGECDSFFRELRGIEKYLSAPPIDGIVGLRDLKIAPGGGKFCYAMDLADDEVPGREILPGTYKPKTLSEVLSAEVALPLRDVLDLGIRLAGTLEKLQRRHLAHRDIKPGNILIANGKAVLADIGLMADMRDATSVVGTPGYEPPEHHGTPQGDVFSLGCTLYQALTGRTPSEFGLSPCKEAETESPSFWRLLAILHKATSDAAKSRYRSAKGLLKDLLAEKRRLFLLAHAKILAAVAASLFLASLAFGIYGAFQRHRPRLTPQMESLGQFLEKFDSGAPGGGSSNDSASGKLKMVFPDIQKIEQDVAKANAGVLEIVLETLRKRLALEEQHPGDDGTINELKRKIAETESKLDDVRQKARLAPGSPGEATPAH